MSKKYVGWSVAEEIGFAVVLGLGMGGATGLVLALIFQAFWLVPAVAGAQIALWSWVFLTERKKRYALQMSQEDGK